MSVVIVFVMLLCVGALFCLSTGFYSYALSKDHTYDVKEKIIYVKGYPDMRKEVIRALAKHKEIVTISYQGIARDFMRLRKNNYMEFYDTLSFDNGYYTGILSGACISVNSSDDIGNESVSLQFNYLTTKKQEKYISKIVKKIAKKYRGKDRFTKIKGAHDYLVSSMKYDSKYYNPYYAFRKGKGICMSYALAYQRILQEMKIPCIYVKGKNHAWNMVKLEGKWYSVDVTWDDSGGTYKYFLKGTADFYGHKLPESGSHKLVHKSRFSYKK